MSARFQKRKASEGERERDGRVGLSPNLAAGCICEETLGSETEGSFTSQEHIASFICPFVLFHSS